MSNLEERVKVETLVESLRALFSEFGQVIDIVAKKNLKAKGQAFVVFDDPQSAQDAVEEIQGFQLFDKPMHVAMARSRSDKTIETKGTADELDQHKRHRLAEKGMFAVPILMEAPVLTISDQRKALETAEEQRGLKRGPGGPSNDRPTKAAKPSGLKSTSVAQAAVVPDEYLPPNKILFLQNVPAEYDVEALSTIFGRFEGFREVRTVPGRAGIAFVEYDAEQGAIVAKENTAGMTLGDKAIKVTYQRQ